MFTSKHTLYICIYIYIYGYGCPEAPSQNISFPRDKLSYFSFWIGPNHWIVFPMVCSEPQSLDPIFIYFIHKSKTIEETIKIQKKT